MKSHNMMDERGASQLGSWTRGSLRVADRQIIRVTVAKYR